MAVRQLIQDAAKLRTMSSMARVAAAVAAIVLVPAASAQVHVQGSGWLHRAADHETVIHAYGDSACTLQFPPACHGGMMGPDSLLCIIKYVPPDSMPGDYCVVGLQCEIRDPDGRSMMSGHGTPMGLFQRQIRLTMHYDPIVLAALGIESADLALITWADGAYQLVEGVTHDVSSSALIAMTTRLADWYGLVDRTALPAAIEQTTWGRIKQSLR